VIHLNASEVGNICLAVGAGLSATAAALGEYKAALIIGAVAAGLKAVGSYLSHKEE
jgi:hypothetical protein